jgi:hypothetical protein
VQGSSTPIGLGRIGDIEFWAPNRGLLITDGNGSTIPPGLWAYNGEGWHELATVCGATDGRIAWAGPEEFWTVSDGRPGQANNPKNGEPAPLEDDTLCHFAGGQVVASYASLAFQANSYQPMHAAGCIDHTDCWFAGDSLPEGQVGAFHLHWNGSSLGAEPYPGEGHAVEDMRLFDGQLYESVRLRTRFHPPKPSEEDPVTNPPLEPPPLHLINPQGISPTFESISGLPLYGAEEFPEALGPLHLSADEEALWAAAGPVREPPEKSEAAGATVVRYSQGAWSQTLGPETNPSGATLFGEDVVDSIAAEPGTSDAWIALDSQADAQHPSPEAAALIARVSADGTVSQQQLPSAGEGGEKGAGDQITCPAVNDCWLATTQGWLFHLAPAGERQLARDNDPAFSSLITYRPPDEGLPQVVPDAPPPDDSGLTEASAQPNLGKLLEEATAQTETRVSVALLSNIHSRLVHGRTLELRFHLSVKARVRLIAKRRKHVVASTPTRTLPAGNRKLLLSLNPKQWPTKLELQTHALAKLPTQSTRAPGNNTVSTGLITLPHFSAITRSGQLP